MNACLIVLGLVLGCDGASPVAQEPVDAWLAEDKLQHFTVSGAATTMGYGAARLVLEPEAGRVAAAAVAAGLGIGKEVLDHRRGGPFSTKDLVWDAAGIVLALALINGIR